MVAWVSSGGLSLESPSMAESIEQDGGPATAKEAAAGHRDEPRGQEGSLAIKLPARADCLGLHFL
eukprot:2952662-Prymnesium_polylepis.1